MGVVNELILGFAEAMTWQNLLFAFVGCLLGTVIGVLPGIGPVAGIALLIPLTLNLDPAGSIIMLCAIFYGTTYGGTITSVLLNTPGEAASAITAIDGYQMTKMGRAGVALTIAAFGSFIGGSIATVGLVLAAKPLGSLGLLIGPPEFFALVVVGISLLVALAGRSMVRALISGALGLLISMVGIDPVMGAPRFTFSMERLLDGVSFVAVIVGVFGLSEILSYRPGKKPVSVHAPGFRSLLPTRQDWKRSTPSFARGTGIGFAMGLIPGMTGSVSSLLSYGAEKKFSKHRAELGHGAIEGVAGPETANNAHANGALIPLFTLGIPASPTIAVLMGAFLQQGLTPGPTLFAEHGTLAWTIIASLFIGNVLLLVLNVPLVGLWTSILRVPYPILAGLILMFMVVGAYTINFSVFDVFVMIIFGLVGVGLRHLDIPLAPMVLTLVLGPLMERSLRESLDISHGSFIIFAERPITMVLLVLALLIIVSPLLKLRKPAALAVDDPES
ncbi:tripartite tricarboxylate transporter permease [Glutamicibacter sp. PS]|uniref:tripartite tricarboxylate transporter permease n=1 Tax=Glutamicibacter sp. PS TaxID=3075634 RepID=UPI0028491536|nr:tripartite tricarboxylate transporter permease [Glutamicibacter sp. PS]MDR4534572.1 tripartite tricarboxylate transporter permease [Glutamicibacter sp. PS]